MKWNAGPATYGVQPIPAALRSSSFLQSRNRDREPPPVATARRHQQKSCLAKSRRPPAFHFISAGTVRVRYPYRTRRGSHWNHVIPVCWHFFSEASSSFFELIQVRTQTICMYTKIRRNECPTSKTKQRTRYSRTKSPKSPSAFPVTGVIPTR